MEQRESIKSKLLSKEYKLKLKRGRSKVWDTFRSVEDANGTQIENIVACSTCFTVLKYSNCTSNLVKHKCVVAAKSKNTPLEEPEVIVSSETKAQIFDAATEWTTKNCRPFSIIQDSGLRKLFELFVRVGAEYGRTVNIDSIIPHPSTLSRKVSELYQTESNKTKDEISNAKGLGYCISSDVWTDNFLKQSYVSCTIHFIKDAQIISRLLAVKSMENDPATGKIHLFHSCL